MSVFEIILISVGLGMDALVYLLVRFIYAWWVKWTKGDISILIRVFQFLMPVIGWLHWTPVYRCHI